jgi:hypothetical protein
MSIIFLSPSQAVACSLPDAGMTTGDLSNVTGARLGNPRIPVSKSLVKRRQATNTRKNASVADREDV